MYLLILDEEPLMYSDSDSGTPAAVARKHKKSRLPSYRKSTAASRARKDNKNR